MAQYLYKYYDEDSGYRGYAVNPTIGSYSGHSSSDMGAWGSSPTLYQYTSTGVLNGYSGFLDLDVFYGNANQWAKLAARS